MGARRGPVIPQKEAEVKEDSSDSAEPRPVESRAGASWLEG